MAVLKIPSYIYINNYIFNLKKLSTYFLSPSKLFNPVIFPFKFQIRRSLERRHLSVVGWYHSHPTFPAQPTIKDVDSQMEYQITMKGDSDSSYTPCLGLICCKFFTFFILSKLILLI